ncbi:hypothetical protein AMTRI_Chr03g50710 [Amborella trichopoda]
MHTLLYVFYSYLDSSDKFLVCYFFHCIIAFAFSISRPAISQLFKLFFFQSSYSYGFSLVPFLQYLEVEIMEGVCFSFSQTTSVMAIYSDGSLAPLEYGF